MKKIFSSATLFTATLFMAAALSATNASAQAKAESNWSQEHELGLGFGFPTGGMSYGNVLVNDIRYKLSEQFVIGTTIRTDIGVRDAGAEAFKVDHKYIRLYLSQSGVYRIGSMKGNLLYRWVPPTAVGSQRMGGWGRFTLRADTSGEFGNNYLLIRTGVNVPVTTSPYEKSVEPGATVQKGVSLVGYSVEFFHGYTIKPDAFGTLLTLFVTQDYKLANKGVANSDTANGRRFDTAKLGWEFEVNAKTNKVVDKSEVALAIGQGEVPMTGFGDVFFKGKALEYTLYLRKTF